MAQNGAFREAYMDKLIKEDPSAAQAYVMSILDSEDPAVLAALDKPGALNKLGVNKMPLFNGLRAIHGRDFSTGSEFRSMIKANLGTDKITGLGQSNFYADRTNLAPHQFMGMFMHGDRHRQEFMSEYAEQARQNPGTSARSENDLNHLLQSEGGIKTALTGDAAGRAATAKMYQKYKDDPALNAVAEYVLQLGVQMEQDNGNKAALADKIAQHPVKPGNGSTA